jgi:hypothetical protein
MNPKRNDAVDAEQSRAFIEKARELGCEENLGRLDDALRRIARAGPEPHQAVKRPRKKEPKPE